MEWWCKIPDEPEEPPIIDDETIIGLSVIIVGWAMFIGLLTAFLTVLPPEYWVRQ